MPLRACACVARALRVRERARVSLELIAGAREAHGRQVVEVDQHFVRLLKTLKTENQKQSTRRDEKCNATQTCVRDRLHLDDLLGVLLVD